RGTDRRIYPWGNIFDGNRLNFCDKNCQLDWANSHYDDGYVHTAPVGSYLQGGSPYGAYDMAGNVSEWVSSKHSSYPYNENDGREELEGMKIWVIRGGSWLYSDISARVTNRFNGGPTFTSNDLGFRCVAR
ncbi:MAG: SUMF1/EgtB/PvdO family nonheme iron enzyme, partial [Chloroflexota bacterium]